MGLADKPVAAEAAQGFAGKTIVFVHNPAADRYHTHRLSIATYASAYRRVGIAAATLDISAPDFVARFAEAVRKPDVLAVHCEQSWGLDLTLTIGGQAIDPYEAFGKPAIAHIRDYPFYPWLRSRTLVSRPNRLLFFTERSAVDFIGPFGGAPAPDRHASFAAHITLDEPIQAASPVTSWADRPIDLLYVGSYADPMAEREKFSAVHPELRTVLDAVIELCTHEYRLPFWRAAEDIVNKHGGVDTAGAVFLDLLVAANQFIRNERRRILLHRLAPHPMTLVWSGPRPPIDLHPDTRVIAGNTLTETLALCRSAKAMAMCLNNFPYSLSERLLSAMARGAVVLCHANAMIEDVFRDGEDILMLEADGANVGDQLATLQVTSRADAIVAAAATKVERQFTADARVGQFLDAIADFYRVRAI